MLRRHRRLGMRWRRLFLAQSAPQDLADIRLRQAVAEYDLLRHLVAGEMLAAVSEERALVERRVLLHDVEPDGLAGLRIGNTDGRRLENAGMAAHDVLDLVRIHVEARDEDHVLLAIRDVDVAALVHASEVAR